MTLSENFMKRVCFAESGCWEWIGDKNGYGYGVFHLGKQGMRTMAHRWSYENHKSPIPEGLVIDHLCRNPICVNPSHLEPVTQKTNVLRGNSPPSINKRKLACKRGHPLTGDNCHIVSTKGTRVCRICGALASKKYYASKKART